MGWGGALDKLLGFFPSRKENIRNQIDATKREMDRLIKGEFNKRTSDKYKRLAVKLRGLEQKVKNS